MRTSRRWLAVLMGGALVMAACSSGNESGGSDGATTTAGEEVTESTAATPTTSGKADDSGNVTAFVEEAGGRSATSDGIVEGGTLYILDHSQGAVNMDPQRIYTGADLGFQGTTITRTLTSYLPVAGPEGAELVADLATDLGTATDGAKTWSFTLRDGVTFEDGSPITCADIRYGISRTWASDVTGDEGPLYAIDYIDVPEGYPGPYTATAEQQAGFDQAIECPDDKNIVFHLKYGIGDFNYTVSLLSFAPVPKAADTGDKYTLRPTSSGPFKIESYEEGKELVLVRNDKWSQASDPVRTPHLDKIVWQYGLDESVIDERMIADQGDDQAAIVYGSLQPQNLQTVFTDDRFADRRTDGYDGYITYTLVSLKRVNCVAIRKAIWLALDREALRTAGGGPYTGTFASGFILPRLTLDFQDNKLPDGLNPNGTPNVEAAQALMDAAKADPKCADAYKYATEEGLRLDHEEAELWTKLVAIWIDSLGKIGVKIKDNPIESSKYYAAIGDDPGDIIRYGWAADWSNASTVIPPLFLADGGNAYQLPASDPLYPEFEARVKAAQANTDRAAQAAEWKALNQWLVDNVWAIPGTYTRVQNIVGSRVRNAFQWYISGWYAVGNMGLAA